MSVKKGGRKNSIYKTLYLYIVVIFHKAIYHNDKRSGSFLVLVNL